MLIVEDNTGLSDADSYLSVEEALEYYEKYGGGDTFGVSVAQQEQALRNGTRIVDGLIRWIGTPLTETQALDWPRQKEDEDGDLQTIEIPKEVKEAVADVAELWLNDDLSIEPIIQER